MKAMANLRLLLKTNICISILLTISFLSYTQSGNTLYFMKGVPQSHMVNPATQNECGFYLGMPVFSAFQLYTDNSALSLSDIMWRDQATDSVITFLHPNADVDDFLGKLKESNYITVNNVVNFVSFGFKVNDLAFTLDFSEKTYAKFNYPGDLFNLVLKGNEDGATYDFSSLAIDVNSYSEIALGVSNRFSDNLVAGAKAKLLFGVGNISNANTDIKLHTELEQWEINSRSDFNASLPGVLIPINEDGDFNLDSIEFEDGVKPQDYAKFFTKNFGLGLDLGVHYKPIDQLTISASLIDLGYIRWKSYTYNIRHNGNFVFEGVDVDLSNDTSDFGEELLDSLKSAFSLTNSKDPYTTYLNGILYIGAQYHVLPQIDFGVLSRTQIIGGRIRQQITLSANFYPSPILAASISYSLMNNAYNTFGLGISSTVGPFNLYLISENIPFAYTRVKNFPIPVPNETRSLNIRIGLNLLFGCNQMRRIMADKPLTF